MKLERLATHRFVQEGSPLSSVVVDGVGLVCLVLSTDDWRYRLVVVSDAGDPRTVELEDLSPHEHGSRPALLSTADGGIAIVADRDLVLHHPVVGGSARRIQIKNRRLLRDVVPVDARVMSLSSGLSDSSRYPISFELGPVRAEQPRHWAVLELDVARGRAAWTNWAALDPQGLEHYRSTDPPKVEALACRGDRLLVSTTGGRTTSVNKWGMDSWALLELQLNGQLVSIPWGGEATPDDEKKRGVHVSFTSSDEFAVLTPHFASGEWKGKQRLLRSDTGEVVEVGLPSGTGTHARIIEHADGVFWIWNADAEDGERSWSITRARVGASASQRP
ncbi:hypothetical protein [Plantibacter sp. YIM 135347]|uniref:hypothetical protein n=1 Tax=Plantibacter sp. YIM 135347 TaxID=3423919 RepID=UPI003D3273CB